MRKFRIYYRVPNLVYICVDGMRYRDPYGRIYHSYDVNPILFNNTSRLIRTLGDFYDWIGFPQASTETRSFRKKSNKAFKRKEAVVMQDMDELTKQSGRKGTFVVHVQYRQNATWQGTVNWVEEQKTCNFRSVLELLKLIDSVVDVDSLEDEEQAERFQMAE